MYIYIFLLIKRILQIRDQTPLLPAASTNLLLIMIANYITTFLYHLHCSIIPLKTLLIVSIPLGMKTKGRQFRVVQRRLNPHLLVRIKRLRRIMCYHSQCLDLEVSFNLFDYWISFSTFHSSERTSAVHKRQHRRTASGNNFYFLGFIGVS